MLEEREPQQLDEECVLEPVEPLDPGALASSGEPLVRDLEGRLWRVRRRTPPLAAYLPLVLIATVASLLVILAFWLAR
jgi:hypothetical protein